jgi:alpha-tubulin suppressor-like RCC1 family protein
MVAVKGIANVKAISAGGDYTCALTNEGKVSCWGNNQYGQLGNGITIAQKVAVGIKEMNVKFTVISTSASFACGLAEDNVVYCWGNNDRGQLGNGTTANSAIPTKVNGVAIEKITRIESQGKHTCLWSADDKTWCWGNDFLDKTKNPNPVPTMILDSQTQFLSVAERGNHTCLLADSGTVECWGRNADGELGDGTNISRNGPVTVHGLSTEVKAVASGDSFGCVLTQDGSVECWGNNQFSQLGNGTSLARNTPAAVAGLSSGMRALSAGYNFACALSVSGRVSCGIQSTTGTAASHIRFSNCVMKQELIGREFLRADKTGGKQ